MIGFRAAGWVCVGALGIALVFAVFGLRGIGLVGQQTGGEKRTEPIEMSSLSSEDIARHDLEASALDHQSGRLGSDSQTQVNIPVSEKESKANLDITST